MIVDAQLRPSNAQSLVGAAGTTVSTNAIDLLSANRNLGRGAPMRAVVVVATAFAGGTSVQAQMISSPNADLSSPTVIASANAVVDASATAGVKLMDQSLNDNVQRYLGFQYVTLGTHTAGAVTAVIVETDDYNPYLPSNTGY